MEHRNSRILWLCIAITAVLCILWETVPLKTGEERLQRLPRTLGSARSIDLQVTAREQAVFSRCHLLKRVYRSPDLGLFVSAVDGTNNRNAVHDPALCFNGAGWKTVDSKELHFSHGAVKVLVLKRHHVTKEVAIWFSEGDRIFHSPLQYWLRASLRRLTFGLSGPEPIRFVVEPTGNSEINWQELFEEFPQLLRV